MIVFALAHTQDTNDILGQRKLCTDNFAVMSVLKNYKSCPTKYLQSFLLFHFPLQIPGEKVH